MSKQDRQGVRTPADIERKYNLGALYNGGGGDSTEKLSMQLDQLAKAFSQYVAETNVKIASLENTKRITLEATGNEIVLTDSDNDSLSGLIIYGKSTGVTGLLSIILTIQGTEEAEKQTVTINVETELQGIEVAEGGNYIDDDGKMWLCDEFDVARNYVVHRVGVSGSYVVPLVDPFEYSYTSNVDVKKIKTYYPQTTITNDKACGMKVEYAADIKAYIDNKIK